MVAGIEPTVVEAEEVAPATELAVAALREAGFFRATFPRHSLVVSQLPNVNQLLNVNQQPSYGIIILPKVAALPLLLQ